MIQETFDAGWLALREPVDHRSRAEALALLLAEWWKAQSCTSVLDLGSGTGSNLRYLASMLSVPQEWTLLDHDPVLLARIVAPAESVSVTPIRGDLAAEGLAEIHHADLVTASALLDLASADWLSSLVEACSTSGCAALFSLTYDGTIEWTVSEGDRTRAGDPDDEVVRDAVNAHQHRDKGLRPALGPAAGPFAEDSFRRRGYRTWLRQSPWRLGPDDAELAQALVAGWVAAAIKERPDQAPRIRAWAQRREAAVAEGDFGLTVGHVDLLALPDSQMPEYP